MDGNMPAYSYRGFICSHGLCRTDDYDLLATDLQEKTPKEVKKYHVLFKKKWKQLAGMPAANTLLQFRLML